MENLGYNHSGNVALTLIAMRGDTFHSFDIYYRQKSGIICIIT